MATARSPPPARPPRWSRPDAPAFVDIPPERFAGYYNGISNRVLWQLHHHLFDLSYLPSWDAETREIWDDYREVNRMVAQSPRRSRAIATRSTSCRTTTCRSCPRSCDSCSRTRGSRTSRIRRSRASPSWGCSPPRSARSCSAGCSAPTCSASKPSGGPRTSCCARATRSAMRTSTCDGGGSGSATGRCSSAPTRCRSTRSRCARRRGARRSRTSARSSCAWKEDAYLLVRVDRLELSKNIVRGFQAFETFLHDRPEWHGKVRFLSLLPKLAYRDPRVPGLRGARARDGRHDQREVRRRGLAADRDAHRRELRRARSPRTASTTRCS